MFSNVLHQTYCNIVLIIYICDVLHQVLRIYMLIYNIIPLKCVALYYNYYNYQMTIITSKINYVIKRAII